MIGFAPCKCKRNIQYVSLLLLQSERLIIARFSGRCPELSAFAPSGRVRSVCCQGKRMTNFHPFIISKYPNRRRIAPTHAGKLRSGQKPSGWRGLAPPPTTQK